MSNSHSRRQYLLKRFGHFLLAFSVLLVINFILPRTLPGDPTSAYIGAGMDEAGIQRMREMFGLNKTLWVQFWLYLRNTLQGNFGYSFTYYPTPVIDLIFERLPRTLFLVLSSITLSLIAGSVIGAYGAWDFGKTRDIIITQGSLLFRSVPPFWIGIMLLFVFGYIYPIFPLSGVYTYGKEFSSTTDFLLDVIWHSILPIVTLSLYFLAGYSFLMRASLLDILPENYIKIAEVKGLSDRKVLFNHAVPLATPPVLTKLGFQLGRAIGGAVVIEVVFSYPGIGQLLFDAVLLRDFPVVQGTFFFLVLTMLMSMFVVDILYFVLDPRVGEQN